MKTVLVDVGIPVVAALAVTALLNFARYVGYREGYRDARFVEKLHAVNEALGEAIEGTK